MKYIQLTQGKRTIVDDNMYEYLNQWKWSLSEYGYACRTSNKTKTLYMHKEILKNNINKEVDHINGDRLDNRKINLRAVTRQQNKWNQRIKTNNTSGYKGVSFMKNLNRSKPWRSYIVLNNKQISLGVYENRYQAAKAYNEGAKKYFGEYARLNEI